MSAAGAETPRAGEKRSATVSSARARLVASLERIRPGRLSLAARTTAVMLVVVATVQALGLAVHARQDNHARRMFADRIIGLHVMNTYRAMLDIPPALRPAELRRVARQSRILSAAIDPLPPVGFAPRTLFWRRALRLDLGQVPIPPEDRPLSVEVDPRPDRVRVALEFPDGTGWLDLTVLRPPPGLFDDRTFLAAWLLVTVTAAILIVWSIRRMTRPIAVLARAADILGRDVNAPPLPEDGPLELARAAHAFNTMASRIRRFVTDRTFVLTAIGHDLRTPITRLKLRCEFIDDDELRERFLRDLAELEQMVASTLEYGRDTARAEPAAPLDLAALLRTVADDAADARPDMADRVTLGIETTGLRLRGRPIALKRCFSNLVGNALSYGGAAAITLAATSGEAVVLVEDEGPGIEPGDMERVFEPFRRLEASRSRETGGAGLGLPIARDIVRAHGGEITLSNRAGGGLAVRVTLPL